MFITILTFIIILSFLVLIHELGHYLTARKFGIKVEEFGLGFPPRVWGKKIGETLYSINALPIGGFVKLFGEDEAGAGSVKLKVKSSTSAEASADKKKLKDLDRAFFAKPKWQRTIVVVSGVVMNFLVAIVIATYLLTFQGIPQAGQDIKITEIKDATPAAISGLKANDLIRELNGAKISDTQALISETRKNLGKEITIVIEREGEFKTLIVTPRKDFPSDQGPLGIAITQNIEVKKYPFPQSIFYGIRQATMDSGRIVIAFKDMMVTLVTRFTVPEGIAGPIGMAQLTGEFVKVGPNAVLALVYMLSLSLAVLNILPIPALDGGRLMFIIIEAVTRRKVNQKVESYAHMIGIVLLLSFLVFISYKDILRIISGESILP